MLSFLIEHLSKCITLSFIIGSSPDVMATIDVVKPIWTVR